MTVHVLSERTTDLADVSLACQLRNDVTNTARSAKALFVYRPNHSFFDNTKVFPKNTRKNNFGSSFGFVAPHPSSDTVMLHVSKK